MIGSLLQLVAGAGAGVIIGVFLGFLLAAREQAIVGVATSSEHPFISLFRRQLRNVTPFEWFIYAAAVLNGCLIILWLAALPLLLSRWLALPRGALLVVAYAVGIVFCCFGYRFGRKAWFNRA